VGTIFYTIKLVEMKRLRLLFFAGLVGALMGSCQKSEVVTEDLNSVVNHEVVAENLLLELDIMAEEAIDMQFSFLKSAGGRGTYLGDNCPVVTYERSSNPKVMTIDFGTGCTGRDGKVRSGKIIVKSSSFENMSASREKSFENFTVENRKVEGVITKTLTLDRKNFSRVAKISEDITITFADGAVVQRKGTLTRELQYGVITDLSDDKLLTWGEVKTTRAIGVVVTKLISEENPLVFLKSCRQIVSGKVSFTGGEGREWSIDYGQGECDGEASLTRDGTTSTIKLR